MDLMDGRSCFWLPQYANASNRVRNVYYASHRVELTELHSETMDSSPSSSSPGPDAHFEQNIRNLIQQSESNLQAIDAEIAHLCSLLEAQYHLRELEHEKLASLRSEIAPIRKVPVELLAKIFLLSLETGTSSQLCISQVSQHWRRVAHNTPRLWQKLSLQPADEFPDDYLEQTKVWIDRSSPLPLSLRILPKRGQYNSYLASTLLSALLSAAHRWQNLETTPEVIHYLPSLPPDAFASLEEIHFEKSWPQIPDLEISAFSTAPRLRCFSNLNVGMRVSSGPTYHMPWKQLTELGISFQAPLCRTILLACENVETVKFEAWGVGEMAHLPVQTLPCLKSLHASFRDAAGFLLDSLALPVLETLTLDAPWDGTPGLAASITQLQLRSPNILTLNLLNVYLDSIEVIHVLRHAPRLTHLVLDECQRTVDDQLFNALEYHPNAVPLVPMLTTLCIKPDGTQMISFSSAAVSRMVCSRWWSDAQLSALAIRPPVARLESVWMDPVDVLEFDLEKCMAEGFNLQAANLYPFHQLGQSVYHG